MRWLVEVSALAKGDAQKYCVEAESWQRALQAARSQRGDEGPMSGFSIELLEEGYRAVDPLARVRFVVKRAPDDMPITITAAKEMLKSSTKGAVAPSAPSQPPPAPVPDATERELKPAPSSSAKNVGSITSTGSNKKSVPPRPGLGAAATAALGSLGSPAVPAIANAAATGEQTPEAKKKAATMTFGSNDGKETVAERAAAHQRPPAAPPVGSSIPGLPAVKLLSGREQEPTESSPLTYREYAFALPAGTTEQVAADVLRAQLRLVEANMGAVKQGKLVNLAAFDIEFTGKPPRPPLAALTWKDWKGDPVIQFPRRAGQPSKQPRPPSANTAAAAPASVQNAPVAQPAPAPVLQAPAFPAPVPAPAPAAVQEEVGYIPQRLPPPGSGQRQAAAAPAPVPVPAPAPAPVQAAPVQAPVQVAPPAPHTAPLLQPNPQPQAQPVHPSSPPPAQAPAQMFAPMGASPVMMEAPPGIRPPSSPGMGGAGQVRTPSGRFVRGRVSGDELITALFESMHDLHFLRDALDGGQFCLALATEVLPSRAALIHFFDIEKREWVVACVRGKDSRKLLTSRTPGDDELLGAAAKRRRAIVIPDATAKASASRYVLFGGGRSLIIAPVMQAGRALGAIEIINPLDNMPFIEDEGNAMTYIAEQYAEYLGSRGIVLDTGRIEAAAASPR